VVVCNGHYNVPYGQGRAGGRGPSSPRGEEGGGRKHSAASQLPSSAPAAPLPGLADFRGALPIDVP